MPLSAWARWLRRKLQASRHGRRPAWPHAPGLCLERLEERIQPSLFSSPTTYAVGANPIPVLVGEFNGDSKLDLATGNYSTNTVSVLLGNGNGTFGAASNLTVSSGSHSLALGDFNTD